MVCIYRQFLKNNFCMSIASKGRFSFPERNLTFNFCSSYLKNTSSQNGSDVFVWQELRIKNASKRGFVDSMILDLRNGVNSLVFIEAKRIANGGSTVNKQKLRKLEALEADMKRLRDLFKPNCADIEIPSDLKSIIDSRNPNIYIMALVDYWEWNGNRETLSAHDCKIFENKTHRKFEQINDTPIHEGVYYLNYSLDNLSYL